jgi:hypothetical protein
LTIVLQRTSYNQIRTYAPRHGDVFRNTGGRICTPNRIREVFYDNPKIRNVWNRVSPYPTSFWEAVLLPQEKKEEEN